jgi:GTP-binding protein
VAGVLPAVRRVGLAHGAALQTARLNEVVAAAVRAQEPPLARGKRPRIYYATQVGRRPPEIAVFTSSPESIPASYQRYLAKHVAEAFRLEGTPIRLLFRSRR